MRDFSKLSDEQLLKLYNRKPKEPSVLESLNDTFEPLRGAARAGKSIAKGAAGLLDLGTTLPYNIYAGLTKQPQAIPFSEKVGQYIDEATGGYTVPRGSLEKAIDTAGEFIGGGGVASGLSRVAGAVPQLAKGLTFLGDNNLPQMVTSGLSGAGSEVATQLSPDSALAPLIGSLAGSSLPSLAAAPKKIAGKIGNINTNKLKAFNEAGIQPTLSNVTDSRFIGTSENILRETPFAGNNIEKVINNAQKQIMELDKGLTQVQAGELAQSSLQDWRKRGSDIAGKLNANVGRHVSPDEGIKISKTLETISSAPKLKTIEAQQQFNNSAIGKEYNKLSGIAERNNGMVPYNDLVYFRKAIDDSITTFGAHGNETQGNLKKLRTEIQRDIGQALKAKGPQAQKDFERFNKFYTQYAKKNEDVVESLLKNKTATETFNSVISNSKIDGRKAEAVINSLKPEQREVFSNSLIKEIGSNAQNEFSGATLSTNFKKLEPEAQNIVLAGFSSDDQKKFRATMDAIDAIKFSQSMANNSRTAPYLAAGTIGTGLITNPIETTALIAASKLVSSQLFTNPKFINWLAEAKNIKSASQIDSHLKNLIKIAQKEPQLAPDINKYLDNIKQGDEDILQSEISEDFLSLSDEELMSIYNSQ